MSDARLKEHLEALYARCNRPEFIYPDPLAAVLRYRKAPDQEVAGLIAAALAFGNVKQILRSVDAVLECLPQPREALLRATPARLNECFGGFRHRYSDGADLIALLLGMRRTIRAHGSLQNAFTAKSKPGDATVLPALTSFVEELRGDAPENNYLLPDPRRGSACKRLMLYLRWMARRDAVDPGPWRGIAPRLLIVPMDTHMHRMALRLGLTRRRSADLRAALEVTAAFRTIAPDDPVRYDFALTRLGIRNDLDPESFFHACGV